MRILFIRIKNRFLSFSNIGRLAVLLLSALTVLAIVFGCRALVSYFSVHNSYNIKKQELLNLDDVIGFENLDDDILAYSSSEMLLTNSFGEQLWQYSYDMQKPKVIKSNNYCAIIDISKSSVIVFRHDKVISSFNSNGNIMTGCISENGVVALIEKISGEPRVDLYDYKGNLIVKNKLGGKLNKYPFNVALSNDGTKLFVSYVSINNTNNTTFDVFDFGDSNYTKSQKLIYEKKLEDLFVTDILCLDDETVVLVGDKKIVIYSTDDSLHVVKKIKNKTNLISVASLNNKLITVNSVESGKALYTMTIYDTEGNVDSKVDINRSFNNIKTTNNQIILYGQLGGLIYSSSGRKIFDGNFDEEIEYITKIEGFNKYLLLTKSNIMEVKLD